MTSSTSKPHQLQLQQQQHSGDLDLFIEHSSSYKSRMQPSENVCDPDKAEAALKQALSKVIHEYSTTATQSVADVRSSLQNEFEKIGLECFNNDYQIQKRLRELFPTQRRLDDIVELIRDATSITLKKRINHRFEELEQKLKTQINRHQMSEPLTSAARNFIQELLHYVSVTVGNRGEFLRHRFNLRLKTLIKAAQEGNLDSWSALSDDDDEDGASPVYLASSSKANLGSFAFAAASSLNGHQKTSPTTNSGENTDKNNTTTDKNDDPKLVTLSSMTTKPRLPPSAVASLSSSMNPPTMTRTMSSSGYNSNNNNKTRASNHHQHYQKITKIESSSTAVLDELTELRRRLDLMTSSRYEEIESLKKSYQDELAAQAAAATEREHRLRTDAADLRVKLSDMDRVLKQTGDLISRLNAQSLRYRKDINLFVELSRDDSLRNCYPLMAKRLTQLERDDLEKNESGEIASKDDEVLQRIGIQLFSFEGNLPSLECLTKQHDILNAMRAALMNHEKTKQVIEVNDALIQENDDLKKELIEVRNKAKRFEVKLRNEASARETKLLNQVKELKDLLDAATRKLRTSHIAVIGTNDELTQDLIQKLQDAEDRGKMLENELQIALTAPRCAISSVPPTREQQHQEEDNRASLVLKRKSSFASGGVKNNHDDETDNEFTPEDDDDSTAGDEQREERLFASRNQQEQEQQQRPQSSSSLGAKSYFNNKKKDINTSSRPLSAKDQNQLGSSSSSSSSVKPIPSRFIEPDTKYKIFSNTKTPRPPSAASSTTSSSFASTQRPSSAFGGVSARLLNEKGKETKDEAKELYERQLSHALNVAPKSARNNGLYWQDSRKGDEKLFDKQFRAAVTTVMKKGGSTNTTSSATISRPSSSSGTRMKM